ncbi:MAG: tetratricopeptide repeat protein, partial [Myxococcota bacterium]
MNVRAQLTGTGLWHPEPVVSNAELVVAQCASAAAWNAEHKDAIERGDLIERDPSTERFIVKASGIHSRYVVEKAGVLDPERLRPHLPIRNEDELSIQAEIAVAAGRQALEIKPDYAEAHNNHGNALVEAGRVEDAIAAYRSALAIRPKFVGALNNLGIALV